jgi:molecular chaperone IbpA
MSKFLDQFFVGGDKLFDEFFGGNLSVDAFPRFNVVQVNETEFELTLALAGWTKDDVKLKYDAGVLAIEGCKKEVPDVKFIHRGISGKAFKRSFLVPRALEVTGAGLTDGLLRIQFKSRATDSTKFIEVK